MADMKMGSLGILWRLGELRIGVVTDVAWVTAVAQVLAWELPRAMVQPKKGGVLFNFRDNEGILGWQRPSCATQQNYALLL